MLVQNLYTIQSMDNSDGIKAVLLINAAHPVFKGHFPEVPVLPGVCMIQILKELIEQEYNIRTDLKDADMIKFLSMMNPDENNELLVDIKIKEQNSSGLTYIASMKSGENIILKYSGSLHIN